MEEARKRRLPTLGICGGMQLMNVAFGGTLYQDVARQIPKALKHRRPSQDWHRVTLLKGSWVARVFGVRTLQVNSSHHQSVKRVANGFRVTALASDGVIEGMEASDGSPMVGVQWHPERMGGAHRRFFQKFLEWRA